MIKLIACDLDETLLTDDKEICERNIEAIKKAEKEYGVKFVPATGRGYTCIQNVLESLDVYEKKNEYIISNNGGILCENQGFKELSFHSLPFAKAKELFAYGIEHGLCIQVFTAKDVYAYQIDAEEEKWLYMFKADAIVMKENTIDFLEDQPIAKILFEKEDMEYLKELAQDMKPITQGEVNVSFSSNRYLEMNRIGVDKGVGLQELASILGVVMEETMAIGDNYNDSAMLEAAGIAVAMPHAPQEIKELCDYICVSDHNDGGVGEAIEKYVFEKGDVS